MRSRDAVAGFSGRNLVYHFEVQKGAYAIFRPSVVGRTNTKTVADHFVVKAEMEIPGIGLKVFQMSSPQSWRIQLWLQKHRLLKNQYGLVCSKTLKKAERIDFDEGKTPKTPFWGKQSPKTRVFFSVPFFDFFYNPNAIAEWPMRPGLAIGRENAPEYIKTQVFWV
ncbi:MAG: hypothetical protein Ct9H300mP19_09160 [Dehalococcoidia bacterium]|nr:MAG: hypothetical protein Ct9H300mP19_09160 [Dehalococcoidia bacterium]